MTKATKSESPKHFKNETINKIAKTDSRKVIAIYVISALAIFSYGVFSFNYSTLEELGLLFGGFALLTFLEYFFHRYVYHSGDNYKDENNWQYVIHGAHHSFPNSKDILAMPLIMAVVVAIVFFSLFYGIMGTRAYFFFPGFLLGYALYLLVHYKIHTSPPPNNRLKYLWVHHHIHHHVDDNKAFGVSTPFWDVIFGTMPDLKKQKVKKSHPARSVV